MGDLLLDVNIAVDICSRREPFCQSAAEAVARCMGQGRKVWLYAGSVQTLQYVLATELARTVTHEGQPLAVAEAQGRACRLLDHFAADKGWLAALAGEGPVFEADDPEDEQLLRALGRFPDGEIALLTKSPHAMHPEQYLSCSSSAPAVPFVDLATQQDIVRPRLEQNLHRVLHHGQYIMGPEVAELEAKLADYVGVTHAIGCSSGTDGLLMALMALGVGPGDAVFTTPFTFVATAEVISLLGATPVFVDIDPATFNLDPAQLESAVQALAAGDPGLHPLPANHRDLTARCVIAVDLYGLPADYDPIQETCTRHGLFLVEDAAQSFGAEYRGRRACSFGDVGVTSFFPAKPLGCYGDGGMAFTTRDDLAEAMRSIRVHGKGSDKYDNVRVGLNARLDTLQAAIVLAKFDAFPDEVASRQAVATAYDHALAGCTATGLVCPSLSPDCRSAWAQYTVRLPADLRGALQQRLGKQGIPSVVYYPRSLHLQTAFAELGYAGGAFPQSEQAAGEVLSLPFGPYFGGVDQVAAALASAVTRVTGV